MTNTHQKKPAEKSGLHPRNKHKNRYDFEQLVQANPALAEYIRLNAYNDNSIDFANPKAVKALNQALLKQFYHISEWDIPAKYLCPPIPGRADYLHYIADLLADVNKGVIPCGDNVNVLDIGVGANVIYPLIGQQEYGWQFVGVDIDPIAISNAQRVLDANAALSKVIELRLHVSATNIFKGVIKHNEFFDLTMCNPPFHSSLNEAIAGTQRKWNNLARNKQRKSEAKSAGFSGLKAENLNFGGQTAELYCEGGEEAFICNMVNESLLFANQCFWFTTLVSKASTLPAIYRTLKKLNSVHSKTLEVKTIDMVQGQKKSRIVAWTFLNAKQQLAWRDKHSISKQQINHI